MMRKITIFLVLLLSLGQLFAQDRTITGKVSDENGAPLLGATVAVKGTTKGTLTDIDGNYSISVSADAVLVFSYVGYLTQEIAVGTNNVLDLTLQPDVQNLEQVVVIGYGVQKKSLVTGSISKIDSKDITAVPAARIDQALQGKTSGVYVAQSSGTPGGAMSVKIRGNSSDGKNDPIYIVNGIKVGSIDFLAPTDIESMEILKDAASSAIYGAEGGNGVVIISTKKGAKGISEVNYEYYHGWQSPANTVDVMDAKQYTQYFREAAGWENKEGTPAYNALINKYNEMEAKGINTNWIDEIFNTAPLDQHSVSFTSGNDENSLRLSATYFDQDGIIGGDKNNFTRYTFNISGDSKLKNWLSVGTNVAYTNSKKKNLPESAEVGRGIINSALNYDPTAPIFYENEEAIPADQRSDLDIYNALVRNKDGRVYYNSPETNTDAVNPLALMENSRSTTNVDKLLGDVHAEIKFFDWLKFNSRLGVEYALNIDDVFSPKEYYDNVNFRVKDSTVSVSNTYTRYYEYTFENFATFSRSFEDHYLEVLGGISYKNSKPTFVHAQGFIVPYSSRDFAYLKNTSFGNVDGGVGSRFDYDRQELQNSYFGRLSYNFKEMFMLQGTVRRDGSSLFGPNNRYATFPSFSVGFNLTKLDFVSEALPYVNTLKARFSWGQNGNKQILDPYAYTSLMKRVVSYVDGSGNPQFGSIPSRPGNPGLRWETSEATDIGLDVGLFKNKVTFSVVKFVKLTKDQLARKAKFPQYLGFQGEPIENNGEVENKGWEFDLAYREMESELKYSLSINASYVKNKVLSYGGVFKTGYKMNIGDFITYYEEGYPIWYYKGFIADGIFQSVEEVNAYVGPDGKLIQKSALPGDVRFKDIASKDASGNRVMVPDGVLDENDRTMIGKPQPDWNFGFNLSLQYKGVDLGVYLNGVTGNQIFFSAMNPSRTTFNKPIQYFEERWTGPNTSNTYPRAILTDKNKSFRASTLNVQDADYLRLKNVTLGYTFPKTWTSIIGIAKLRIFASGNNMLTLTKFKGTDPEIGQLDISQNNSFGIDRGLYPQPKLYTAGINVTF